MTAKSQDSSNRKKTYKPNQSLKTGIIGAALSVILAYLFLNPYYLFPDGQGYFSYLPSLFYDNDIHFYNEFVNMKIPIPLALTQTGYISNNWTFGTASPEIGHYSSWFWLWVNFGTIFYGVMAFFFFLLILKHKDLKLSSGHYLITALAFVGTPMFFYTFSISSTSHAISAFASTMVLVRYA